MPHFSKRLCSSNANDPYNNEDTGQADIEHHNRLLQEYQLKTVNDQNVFVIQPYITSHLFYKTQQKSIPNPELMLNESVALIKTLGWRFVGSEIIGVPSFQRSEFFGSGQVERLKDSISAFPFISSIFLSSYQLGSRQRLYLEQALEKPIFDRYSVVLQIFRLHARTRESKLQVELAEIPYLKHRLYGDLMVENENKHSKGRMGQEHFEKKEMMLKRRSSAISNEISHLAQQRTLLRKNRNRLHIPSIAVVGYTNCGKTSLINALSEDQLMPQDCLFATLDVTVHEGFLPNKLKILYVDTVGFLSDIPTKLIASFSATLEDAAVADLLIHVRDASHPDCELQKENVIETLKSLNIDQKLIDNMITVANKMDKIDPASWPKWKEIGAIPISATQGFGLQFLLQKIEKTLMSVTGRKILTIRCKTGGQEFAWIQNNLTVHSVDCDEKDSNYSLVSVIASQIDMERLKKMLRKTNKEQ